LALSLEPDFLPDLADREITAFEKSFHMGHFYLQQKILPA
jgi:hypothetical protein